MAAAMLLTVGCILLGVFLAEHMTRKKDDDDKE